MNHSILFGFAAFCCLELSAQTDHHSLLAFVDQHGNSTASQLMNTAQPDETVVKENEWCASPNEGYPLTLRDLMKEDSHDGSLYWIADVFLGYSNFSSNSVSPKPGLGFGIDTGVKCDYVTLWDRLAEGLFGELTVGYAMRGSGAYPIHYLGCRALPLGYHFPVTSSIDLAVKAGMYFGLPLSDVKTRRSSYGTNFDWGLSFGIGAEYKDYGLYLTFEGGLDDAVGSYRTHLSNEGVFLTLSYKIRTLK